MTTRHVIDYYLDGHVTVAFCKVCSAEGNKLFDDCPQKIVDDKEQPAKEMSIELRGMVPR